MTGNATRWYTTRDAVKAAVGISGADLNPLIDSYIEAASEDVEELLTRRFIPETAVKYFRWPSRRNNAWTLFLEDNDLIAVTLLQTRSQDTTPITITAADYFLEPNNIGPPYSRIEIDLASSSAFDSGQSPQRSIGVTGRWGFREDTKAAGALAAAISTSAVLSANVTDSSLIGVGDTILIDTEALFVSEKTLLTTTATTAGADRTANKAETTIPVNTGTLIKQGEVIQIDSERMLVESIAANNLTVQRAFDGTVLAAHTSGATVFAYRTLTIVRGVNGTTPATHNNAATIARYAPPADIVEYTRAVAIAHREQGRSGWTGMIGGEGGTVETRMFGLWALRSQIQQKYGRVTQ